MEKKDMEIIARLVTENDSLKKYVQQHQEYESQLEEYNSRLHLTSEEWMERKKIQKLKLAVRDKIERILAQHRRAQGKQASS
ncbi:MAG: DUF465 domain-containing protein [Deltaproteobacteria bacterium]|nr:MAG: DUF465 domain-containing protein [Deltaproteobacteria bacterium]RLB94994.1 MAG: DUF465 domain-containing protein [Deltaproteobacteria bacterium]